MVVFSKTYCPYCTKAKRALAAAGAKGVVVHEVGRRVRMCELVAAGGEGTGTPLPPTTLAQLDTRADGDAIQSEMGKLTGGTSVPRVFVGGKFIGGGDDTAALQASGRLAPLLSAAGALA